MKKTAVLKAIHESLEVRTEVFQKATGDEQQMLWTAAAALALEQQRRIESLKSRVDSLERVRERLTTSIRKHEREVAGLEKKVAELKKKPAASEKNDSPGETSE